MNRKINKKIKIRPKLILHTNLSFKTNLKKQKYDFNINSQKHDFIQSYFHNIKHKYMVNDHLKFNNHFFIKNLKFRDALYVIISSLKSI